ncbi:MAG: hypothetical protein QXL15_02380 [Candidatus Korarchaeota archaeon]
MNKDKIVGALLVLLGLVAIYFYLFLFVYVVLLDAPADWHIPLVPYLVENVGFEVLTLLTIPVALLVIVLGVILVWIGVTMIRTPPPVPLEGFETVEEAPAAEKEKAATTAPAEPAEPEEKKTTKRKKTQ